MKKLISGLMIGLLIANFAIGGNNEQLNFTWSKLGKSPGEKKSFKTKVTDKNFKISMQNGLPSNQVKAIVKLPGGGYAFGTDHGLCLWQNGVLTTYTGPEYMAALNRELRENSPLPHNNISDLLIDGEGVLWVATSRGICRIKDGQWEVLKIQTAQQDKGDPMSRMADMSLNDIQELFLSTQKEVVFGGRNAGVFIYNPKSKKISTLHSDDDANHWVTAIDEDAQGNLWVAIFGVGLLKYDGKTSKIFTEKEDWIPSNDIRSSCVDKQGNLWVGTHSGLGVKFANGKSKVFTEKDVLPDNNIWDLICLENGEVWGNADGKIFVYKDEKWAYPTLKNGKIFCAGYGEFDQLEDGALWLGCINGPIRNPSLIMHQENQKESKFPNWQKEVAKKFPEAEERVSLKLPGKKVWAIFDGKQLWEYDGKNWHDLTQKYKLETYIRQLATDEQGRILIGTSGHGFLVIDKDKVLRFNDKKNSAISVTYDIAVAKDGSIYIGTQSGLYCLQGETLKLLTKHWAQYLYVIIDKDGNIWLLEANSGVFIYKDGEPQRISGQAKLDGYCFYQMRLNKDGYIRVDGIKRTEDGETQKTFDCTVKKVTEVK